MVPYYYNWIWFHSLGYCCFLGLCPRPRRSLNMYKYHSEIVQETIPNCWLECQKCWLKNPWNYSVLQEARDTRCSQWLAQLMCAIWIWIAILPLRKTLIMGVVNDNVFVFSARSIEVCFCLSWKSIRSIALPRALGYKSGLRFKAAYKG